MYLELSAVFVSFIITWNLVGAPQDRVKTVCRADLIEIRVRCNQPVTIYSAH